MSMARRVPTPPTALTGWLETVQRDPRTMGAFRRRIETLLRDPAVARRVAGRLEHRREVGLAEPLGLRDDATPDNRFPGTARTLIGAFLCDEAGAVSIFGRCECRGGPCRLMRREEGAMSGRPPELRAPPHAAGMLPH